MGTRKGLKTLSSKGIKWNIWKKKKNPESS